MRCNFSGFVQNDSCIKVKKLDSLTHERKIMVYNWLAYACCLSGVNVVLWIKSPLEKLAPHILVPGSGSASTINRQIFLKMVPWHSMVNLYLKC